jgi:hypothetical protein
MSSQELQQPQVVGTVFDREINTHTLIGLGMIACIVAVIWLLRRNA